MKKLIQFTLLAIILVCASTQTAQAQYAKGNYNFLDFQQKPYYFGITLGYNKANFRIFRSDMFIGNDSISTVNSVTGPGLSLIHI